MSCYAPTETDPDQPTSTLYHRLRAFQAQNRIQAKSFAHRGDSGTAGKSLQLVATFGFGIYIFLVSKCVQFLNQSNAIPTDKLVVQSGLLGLCSCIIFCYYFQAKDGLLIRPHPGFWKVVHGINVCHLVVMAILGCLPIEHGVSLVKLALPGLSPDEEPLIFAQTLDLRCPLSLDAITSQLSKIWFYSHIIGYFSKMVIMRDWTLCLILSVAFECVELSFQWLIPEFKECWWDSIVLDMCVSNVLGMAIGFLTLRCIDCLPYNWFHTRSSPATSPSNRSPSMPRADDSSLETHTNTRLGPWVPPLWARYNWRFFSTPLALVYTIAILLVTLLTEFNVFMIMYIFGIPAMHHYHKVRVTYMCFLAVSAVAEVYDYLTRGNTPGFESAHLGPISWLYVATISVETLVLFRYGQHKFHGETPEWQIVLPWVVSIAFFGIWCYCHFVIVGPERLDVSRRLWNRCLASGALLPKPTEKALDDVINGLIEEKVFEDPSDQLCRSTPKTSSASESAGLRPRKRVLGSRVPPSIPRSQQAMTRKDFKILLKSLAHKKQRYGVWFDLATLITALPPLLSFLPLIALGRYYKMD